MRITDEYRLGYFMESEAYLAWDREGESCTIFKYTESDIWEPVCGWGTWFGSAKDAIDAAMKKSRFLSRDWES